MGQKFLKNTKVNSPPNFNENELLIIINNLGAAIHTPRAKNVKSVRGVPMVGF